MAAERNSQDLLALSSSNALAGIQAGGVASEAEKPKGMDFGIYIRMLLRNLPLIAIVSTLTATPFILQALDAPKSYQGNFRILVEPITSQGRANDPSALTRQTVETNTVDYPTLLQVLQSSEILERIAKQIRVKYQDVTTDSLRQDILMENLTINRVGENQLTATSLLEVSYQGENPERVDFILKEFKKGYLRYSLDDRRSRIGGGVQFIEEQLPDLQKRVNLLQNRLQELRQRYQLANPETESAGVSGQLQSARSQRLETQRVLAEQAALFDRLKTQLGMSTEEAMAAAALSENPRYQELVGELKKVETQIAIRSARFTDKSPVLDSLQRQRENLRQLLSREAQQNLGERVAASDPRILAYQNGLRLGLIKQLVETTNNQQVLQVRERELTNVEASLNQRFLKFPLIVREYNDIQQKLEIATKTLNQFLTQRETLRVEAAQKEVPWELVADAQVGRVATKPSKKLLMGVGLGLFLGLLLAFLKEMLQNRFLSSEDVLSITKLPALGFVPQRRGLAGLEPAVSNGMRDPFSQAFNSMYTNIRFLPVNPSVNSLVVSSAGAADGKTTVASHLAMAAAAMGQKVLLVDANLRSPSLHNLFNLPNYKGLGEILSDGNLAWQEVIQPTTLDENLFVLPAGQSVKNAGRLLASQEVKDLITQLEQVYDLVIFDTPNMIEASDASFLAAETSGILLVVSINRVKCPAVKQVLKEAEKFRLKVLGVVPNHVGKAYEQKLTKPLAEIGQGDEPAMLENLNIFRPQLPAVDKQSRDVMR